MRQKIFALDGALRATAQEALAMDRSRATAFFAGLALAMAGDTRQAAAVVDELSKRFPGDTVVNNSWGPTIRSEIEVNRGNASKAIELLQLASPYETGLVVRLVPNYARGQAYLKARQAKEAAAEFQKNPGSSRGMPDRTRLRPVPSPTGPSARSVRRRGCGPTALPGI